MGNRVKGRTKPKSIKAATHSGMSSKRKLSRMGKVRKKNHAGIDATFIGRAKVLKRLQISLKDFRRLCILKGVYPREPRGRAPSNKKGQVFYHIKDVKALNHEPLLDKFREFRTFMKKIRKSANRNEKDEARRKEPLAPRYTLHHLVRERYPRFNDALADLDDALCLISLFAALPSDGRIKSGITRKAKELSASWGAYCSVMGCVTKSFISVKVSVGRLVGCTILSTIEYHHSHARYLLPSLLFRESTSRRLSNLPPPTANPSPSDGSNPTTLRNTFPKVSTFASCSPFSNSTKRYSDL